MESRQADQITYCGTSGVMPIAAIPGMSMGAWEKASFAPGPELRTNDLAKRFIRRHDRPLRSSRAGRSPAGRTRGTGKPRTPAPRHQPRGVLQKMGRHLVGSLHFASRYAKERPKVGVGFAEDQLPLDNFRLLRCSARLRVRAGGGRARAGTDLRRQHPSGRGLRRCAIDDPGNDSVPVPAARGRAPGSSC